MKLPSCGQIFLAIGLSLFYSSCKDADTKDLGPDDSAAKDINSVPSKESIIALNLKKGKLIACGPRDDAFGLVGFETSCEPELKNEFDMGVALLHSFEYDEAEKVFAKLIDAQPSCAMAYWGVAMANYHTLWAPPTAAELEKGNKAIAIAASIPGKTAREKSYIDALAAFYNEYKTADHATRYDRFEKAMSKLYADFPDDPEAAIFYSLVLTGGASPTDKSFVKQKQAVGILQKLYKDKPDHPGIVHYIIHSYDNPQLASLALPEARRYASLAPSSAHAQHMPSHIFTRLGLWQEDVQSNLNAANSAKCYGESTGISGHWDEELHSLDYLVYAYLQMGDNASAKKQVDYINAIKSVSPANAKVAYALSAAPARYALENRDWKAAAALQLHTGVIKWNQYPWEKAIHVFARTLGELNTGQTAKAAAGITELEQLRDSLLAKKDLYKANQVDIQLHSARAWLLYRSGKNKEAVAMMKTAADMEDKTQKHAVTPGEVLPARELLGDMLLSMNKPSEAIIAYQADLAEHPNRFNALYNAGTAALKTKQPELTEKYYRQLVTNAGESAADRKELAIARKVIAGR